MEFAASVLLRSRRGRSQQVGPRQQSCGRGFQRLAGSGADEEGELLLTEDPVAWLRLKGLGWMRRESEGEGEGVVAAAAWLMTSKLLHLRPSEGTSARPPGRVTANWSVLVCVCVRRRESERLGHRPAVSHLTSCAAPGETEHEVLKIVLTPLLRKKERRRSRSRRYAAPDRSPPPSFS